MKMRQIKQFATRIDPMRAFPLALGSLVVVTIVVDILLAFQPAIISPLRDGFQHWVGAGTGLSSWPGLFAASVSVLSISVAAAILSKFIQGVKKAPYLWLAPLLVSACTLVINGLSAKLPWPVPTPLFAALSALLIVGGGEVFLIGATLRIISGLTLIFAPLALLGFGYLQSKPVAGFNADEQLLMVILVLASLGALAISVVSQRLLQDLSKHTATEQKSDYLRSQIIELLERCNTTEARALRAEQQLAQLQAFPVHENQRR
jgi:hypothetical protein